MKAISSIFSQISDPEWWDGLLLGFACGVLIVIIPILWWMQ